MSFGTTQTFTVTNTNYSQVTVQSGYCRQVTVGESPAVSGYPTTDFLVAKPSTGNTPRRVVGGQSYTFIGPFVAGSIAGYVETVTGTTTFYQDEA